MIARMHVLLCVLFMQDLLPSPLSPLRRTGDNKRDDDDVEGKIK